ncbi:TnsA-like heteromeric transposase endonuclease subunit [Streptomyces sp. NPDC059452]|uniref:TnsA-like heteromeric transposase endonuclease subunit n=1 Tax=Streptomyces sp. NPDC059452 TaxID=3346835 RepID=UPI0036B89453
MADHLSRAVIPGADVVQVRYRQADGEFTETTLDRLMATEVVAGLPVRDFRWYKGRRHYSGWYHSVTGDRLVAYESRLELARILLADFARDVVGIAAQPFLVTGDDGVRRRRHVPDLLLVHADGLVTVVDVKAPQRIKDPDVVTQFAWMKGLCSLRGWVFEAWTGTKPVVMENVRFLAGYRRRQVVESRLFPEVLEAARVQGTIGGIEKALSRRHLADAVRPALLHLVWTGALSADLSDPLSSQTSVRLAGEGGNG